MEWRERAKVECDVAFRNWKGTLTFHPDQHAAALMAAIGSASMRLGDFHEGDREQRFIAVHRVLSQHVTRWLKRVRKESGARFRYIVVAEYHHDQLDGLPHYHCLIHEQLGQPRVLKAVLREQWTPNGFSKWKLCEDTQHDVDYACKYLSKEAAARVRASQFYGHPWDGLSSQCIAEEPQRDKVDSQKRGEGDEVPSRITDPFHLPF